ncbi:MAG: Fic family protein [Alphaproteobacteria bacterium]|nr:Fic family protein [Alphaproteobacteria bacterium]
MGRLLKNAKRHFKIWKKTRCDMGYDNLELFKPDSDSDLMDYIVNLEHLRRKELTGTTPVRMFFELKEIFHMIESVASARIEGNRTTVAEYIEAKASDKDAHKASIEEITNIEKSISFIEETAADIKINHSYISHLHNEVVKNLSFKEEGSLTPGEYRKKEVSINRSQHQPPEFVKIRGFMDELIEFINQETRPQFDLIKTATFLHRFLWIHPFDNGNGRTARLLMHAMLIKLGFAKDDGARLLNPNAHACLDRDGYNHYLSLADSGKREDVLAWCEFVLSGLCMEMEKIDKLLDYNFLKKEIIRPAVAFIIERDLVNSEERKIISIAVNQEEFEPKDVKQAFPDKSSANISYLLKKMQRNGLIKKKEEKGRQYILSLTNSIMIRGVIEMLSQKGFASVED